MKLIIFIKENNMVVFKSQLDGSNMNNVVDYNLKKNKKAYIVLSLVFVVFGLLLVFLGVSNKDSESKLILYLGLGIFWVLFGILYTPFVRWLSRAQQKQINQSMPLLKGGAEITYKFDENKLFVYTVCGDKFREATEMDYGLISDVAENEQVIMLFISKAQCHVINKSDLVSGTVDEVHEILKKHIKFEI